MQPSNRLPYFFLGLAAVLAAAAVAILILRPGVPVKAPVSTLPPRVAPVPAPPKIGNLTDPGKPEDPATTLKDLGIGYSTTDPAELVAQIGRALEAGDLAKLGRLVGKDALDPATIERLKTLSATPLKLRQPDGVREVGEIELNARSRWALELAGQEPGRDRIFLDLHRENGKWFVEKIMLPPAPESRSRKRCSPIR